MEKYVKKFVDGYDKFTGSDVKLEKCLLQNSRTTWSPQNFPPYICALILYETQFFYWEK